MQTDGEYADPKFGDPAVKLPIPFDASARVYYMRYQFNSTFMGPFTTLANRTHPNSPVWNDGQYPRRLPSNY